MNYVLYANGASGNHGCEAIARGTVELLGQKENHYRIQSDNPDEDKNYGLDALAEIFQAQSVRKKSLRYLAAYGKLKLTGNYVDMDGLAYLSGIKNAGAWADIALSVGGDNYCYNGEAIYAFLNRAYRKVGAKTVLWGCSIDPSVTEKKDVAKDLMGYDLIVARESITFDAVRQIQANTLLAPDPAFFMKPESCAIDPKLEESDIIGINISPMIMSYERNAGMAYQNYRNLIQYILQETDASIALIPHVVWARNDDRQVLWQLYQEFNKDPRLVLIKDHCAPELKYIISKCDFFVGARTHATIAAYSSGVPTLVVGYSVKAKGIARDLFGEEESYILPVQSMTDSKQLTYAFQTLYRRKDEVREHLSNVIPQYLERVSAVQAALCRL